MSKLVSLPLSEAVGFSHAEIEDRFTGQTPTSNADLAILRLDYGVAPTGT